MTTSRVGAYSAAVIAAVIAGALVGGCHKPPTEPTPTCTYSVTPLAAEVSAGGASVPVTIATQDACVWGSASQVPWLTAAPAQGVGPAIVAVTAAPNATPTRRVGNIVLADQNVAITQAPPDPTPACTYAVRAEPDDYPAQGGTGQVTIVTTAGCSWSAHSAASWVVITSAPTGVGGGQVTVRVDANSEPPERSAVISVADRTVTVTQRGDPSRCQYTVTPVDVTPCMVGMELTTSVATANACPWTATSTADWLEVLSGASGSGSGVIRFRTTSNWEAPRFGQVLVRWPAVTAGQNVRVAQAGCRYGVSRTAIPAGASGGAFSFDVVQQSDPYECGGPRQNACQWSAVSHVPWITLTGTMPRTGDAPVAFTVAPNGSGATRTGTVTVSDQVVVVTQLP